MLNKKAFISLALAASLTVTLVGCSKDEKEMTVEPVINNELVTNTMKEAEELLNSAADRIDVSNMSQEQKDEIVINYYESLSVSLDNLWQDVKVKGPEALGEVTDFLKDIVINVVDFKNGVISINGVYYSDLSAEGKRVVDGLIGGLVTTVEMINPNLSEDLRNIFGDDVADSLSQLKDSALEFGSEILDWAGNGINNTVEEWKRER